MLKTTNPLHSCPHCGLVQTAPQQVSPSMRVCCARCEGTLLRRSTQFRSGATTACIAMAALILYPFAVGLPMVSITKFGHEHESSILAGIWTLLGRGHIFIGLIVLVCALVIPVLKLGGLFVLSTGGLGLTQRHRALTYRLVEWTGRWGMLDVLLVAILVAVLKLGDLVEVSAGPAAVAFGLCVLLSLLAAASFDPHRIWESEV